MKSRCSRLRPSWKPSAISSTRTWWNWPKRRLRCTSVSRGRVGGAGWLLPEGAGELRDCRLGVCESGQEPRGAVASAQATHQRTRARSAQPPFPPFAGGPPGVIRDERNPSGCVDQSEGHQFPSHGRGLPDFGEWAGDLSGSLRVRRGETSRLSRGRSANKLRSR